MRDVTSHGRCGVRFRYWFCNLMLLMFVPSTLAGDSAGSFSLHADANEFTSMSIEQLMNIQVTSVSGTAEPWFTTPAAMYVITGDDVRRSGHRNIAEALRLAPGLSSRQINSSTWSVSSRGFDGRFANKLLVLIDGRSVYYPVFSGVLWDVQDTLLEDLDRIEVIRGPGATLWGSNAVNGVINVTTKSARDTQGLYVSGGAGTEERGFGAMRYGGQLDDRTWYRVWGKYDNRDSYEAAGPGDAHDDWDLAHTGVRVDRDLADDIKLTVAAEYYSAGRIGESIRVPVVAPVPTYVTENGDGRTAGGHVLARLSRDRDLANGWSLQSYLDRSERVQAAGFQTNQTTFDLDFRHRFELGDSHDLIWGLGLRQTFDQTQNNDLLAYSPSDRHYTTFSGFIQDTIHVVPDELMLMVGTKFEHNSFTGFEVQPSARLAWTPSANHALWGAVSRPVRVASRTERDLQYTAGYIDTGIASGGAPSGIIVPITVAGDDRSDSEELIAWELGYRWRPRENVTLDLTAFFNDYDRVQVIADHGSAESFGLEAAGRWNVCDHWRLDASYSFLRLQSHGDLMFGYEGDTPRNQFQVRSMVDITPRLEFNSALYYFDNVPDQDVPSYWRLDLGVTWRPTDRLELAVWGQNLLDAAHPESLDPNFQASVAEVERGVYLQATIRF